MSSDWRRVLSQPQSRSRSRQTARHNRGRQLRIESLEQRRVLAAVLWDGGGGDFLWSNPLNWSGDALPGAGDDVVIDVPGSDVTVIHSSGTTAVKSLQSHESLVLSGGSLTINDSSIVHAGLTLTDTTLNAAGGLHVGASMDWTGGVLTGVMTVLADMNISGEAVKRLENGILNLEGTTTFSGGGDLQLSTTHTTHSAVINNRSGAVFLVQSDARIAPWSASGSNRLFNNEGTLRKTAGATTTIVDFNSTGIIELLSGTLNPLSPTSILFENNAYLVSASEATLVARGHVAGTTRNAEEFRAHGRLLFNGAGTVDSPQLMEVMGSDRGAVPSGFLHNFAHGLLELNSTYVQLVDESNNAMGDQTSFKGYRLTDVYGSVVKEIIA